MTTLRKALAELLRDRGQAVITEYHLFTAIVRLYEGKTYGGEQISLRKEYPTRREVARAIGSMIDDNVLTPDRDLQRDAFRVLVCPDEPADEVACEVDPFVYVSHLSAMQRYSLTDRNPLELSLSRPARDIWKKMAREKAEAAVGRTFGADYLEEPKYIVFPASLRKRPVRVHDSRYPGAWRQRRDSSVRVASVGQTFTDMVTRPQWCGGMSHVLSVWSDHAPTYLEEIVEAVERSSVSLVKVRSGYILDERLQLADDRILSWLRHAQRGGSQRLDPSRPYGPTYSEKWMISLNADDAADR